MCLAVPAKVVMVNENCAEVQWGEGGDGLQKSIRRQVRLDLVEDVNVGDYILVHGGFAIHKMDEIETRESLDAWRKIFDELSE